jgi:hypothetical protein
MMKGDGNDSGSYYTSSNELAHDFCRLLVRVGIKPRYGRRDKMWVFHCNRTNDGFSPTKHVTRMKPPHRVYRLTVEDYSLVIAGEEGKFQWCGVSGVA